MVLSVMCGLYSTWKIPLAVGYIQQAAAVLCSSLFKRPWHSSKAPLPANIAAIPIREIQNDNQRKRLEPWHVDCCRWVSDIYYGCYSVCAVDTNNATFPFEDRKSATLKRFLDTNCLEGGMSLFFLTLYYLCLFCQLLDFLLAIMVIVLLYFGFTNMWMLVLSCLDGHEAIFEDIFPCRQTTIWPNLTTPILFLQTRIMAKLGEIGTTNKKYVMYTYYILGVIII